MSLLWANLHDKESEEARRGGDVKNATTEKKKSAPPRASSLSVSLGAVRAALTPHCDHSLHFFLLRAKRPHTLPRSCASCRLTQREAKTKKMTLNASDVENLASMLDSNRAFQRPEGQVTGFSLEEQPLSTGRSGHASSSAMVVSANDPGGASLQPQGNPAGIALPPTVVDHQLRLPQPSHGKKAERKKQLAQPSRPSGDEIWTQAELAALFMRQRRDGPAPVAAAARAAAQQASLQSADGQPRAATLWRPSPSDAGTFEEPVHTVLYQQNVSAEDVYLGVDFTRDASSAASDGVTVRVELPRVTSVSEITMEVDAYELRVSVAGVYYLAAPLPRRVQKTAADAAWDAQKKMLTVRLKADRSSDSDVKIVA